MLLFQREILRFAEGISPLPSADPRQPVIRAKSTIVSPLECALTRRSPVSPLECAVIKKGGRGVPSHHFCIGKSVGDSGGLLALPSSSGYRRRRGSGTCTLLDLSMLMSSSALTTALPR